MPSSRAFPIRTAALVVLLGLSTCTPAAPLGSEAPAPLANSSESAPATAPFAADVPLREHAESVVDYTLQAKLDPIAHTVHGEGTIQWRNTSDLPQSELYFHLYLNAFKNQKSVFLREPVGWGARGTGAVADWGTVDVRKLTLRDGPDGPVELWPQAELHRPGDEDETDVRVPLPRAIEPGESITLDIVFDDKLPTVVERTGYGGSFHMMAQWFPKLARLEKDGKWAHFPFHHLGEFYADYGSYDVTLDVPEGFVIGATGKTVEARTENGRRIERHQQSDVHDFAWTAWDRFQPMKDTIDGIEVTVLYPPDVGPIATRQLDALRFAIPYFGQRYGRYPYPLLTVVFPPRGASEAGGMEYPTLITTGGNWYTPRGIRSPELVTVHEFGHEYFYGLLGSDEVMWPFLDEGINSFAEADALQAWLGKGSLADLFGIEVSDFAAQMMTANLVVHDEPVAQPAYAFSSGWNYGALVYSRTSVIVETLRRVYGDANVRKAMGLYARRWRFGHPKPDDLLACFAEVVGEGAAAQLRAALFDKAWVDYKVIGIANQKQRTAAGIYDRDGRRETVAAGSPEGDAYEGSVSVARHGTLVFPIDVDLVLADGSKQRVHWDGQGDEIRFPYRGNVALASAVIDPETRVLLDQNRTNNHASASSSRLPTRILERTTYWAELMMQLLSL